MGKKTIIIIFGVIILVSAGMIWNLKPSWYLPVVSLEQCTGKITVKLNVPGKPSANVADVLVYDPKDIQVVREALSRLLGSSAKIEVVVGLENSPLVSLTATRKVLRILENSELVNYFASSEPFSLGPPSGSEGMPTIGNPKFRWSYSKSCGYRAASYASVGETCSQAAKVLTQESVYDIYESGCRNIPQEARSF